MEKQGEKAMKKAMKKTMNQSQHNHLFSQSKKILEFKKKSGKILKQSNQSIKALNLDRVK